jgi:hypothetical protein
MKKLCCILLCLANGFLIFAQNLDSSKGNNSSKIAPERSPLLSNLSSRTAGVPNGWGNSSLIGGIGINFSSQAHSFTPNLVAVAGGGTNIFHRNLNLSGTINLNDVRLRNYSLDLKISKMVGRGSSISVGGIRPLFYSNLSGQPFQLYTAFSHAVQTLPSNTPGFSKLSYTIGLGSKNVDPVYINNSLSHKAKVDNFKVSGSSIRYFTSLSYEALKNINVNLGWSSYRGFNVGLTTSWTPARRSLNPHSQISVPSTAPGLSDESNCCTASKPVEAPSSFLRKSIMEKLKGAGNVSLDLYVMSQCPFGVKAEKALIPILKEIGNKATFNLFYIVNETTEKEFKSLHGESEVMEDRRQLVIARHFPNKLLDYLLLRASNYHSKDEWVKSANAVGLNVDSINQLVNQKEEIEAFRTNISNSNSKKVFASPSLFINSKKYKGAFSLEDAKTNQKVCSFLKIINCTSDEDCKGTCMSGPNMGDKCSKSQDCGEIVPGIYGFCQDNYGSCVDDQPPPDCTGCEWGCDAEGNCNPPPFDCDACECGCDASGNSCKTDCTPPPFDCDACECGCDASGNSCKTDCTPPPFDCDACECGCDDSGNSCETDCTPPPFDCDACECGCDDSGNSCETDCTPPFDCDACECGCDDSGNSCKTDCTPPDCPDYCLYGCEDDGICIPF